MATPVRSIRPAPVLESAVARNGGGRGLSHRLAQIADRYQLILDLAAVDLTRDELLALCDVCAGTLHEPAELLPGSLAQGWRDSLPDGVAEKWSIDGAALLARLDSLTVPGELALIEEIEGYWAQARERA